MTYSQNESHPLLKVAFVVLLIAAGTLRTNRRRGNCKKRSVKKAYIEDLVVGKIKGLLIDETIDKIAIKVSDLCQKERNPDTLKRLNKQLRENEAATGNLIKALESGKVIDVIAAQIEKRQAEHLNLEAQLARERMLSPDLTFEQVKYFFSKFKDGDVDDLAYRRGLVDTFVRKIYLFDDKLIIICNAGDQTKICPLSELGGSFRGRFGGPKGDRTPDLCIANAALSQLS